MAERVGFEPTRLLHLPAFQASAIGQLGDLSLLSCRVFNSWHAAFSHQSSVISPLDPIGLSRLMTDS